MSNSRRAGRSLTYSLAQRAAFAEMIREHGFFIVLSLLWGWGFDGDRPDKADVIGATIALVGVCLMYYWPRAVVTGNV